MGGLWCQQLPKPGLLLKEKHMYVCEKTHFLKNLLCLTDLINLNQILETEVNIPIMA